MEWDEDAPLPLLYHLHERLSERADRGDVRPPTVLTAVEQLIAEYELRAPRPLGPVPLWPGPGPVVAGLEIRATLG